MSIVLKCMTIMSIIITEEDLCKKHAKKCAKICQFSSLPSKCFQAANDPNTKNDSKPHICAYNYNTRTGFRDHKKIWGSRVLSSALLITMYVNCKHAERCRYIENHDALNRLQLWRFCVKMTPTCPLCPPSLTPVQGDSEQSVCSPAPAQPT